PESHPMSHPFRLLRSPLAFFLAVTLFALGFPLAQAQKGPEVIELFNGKDLTGWTYKKGQPLTGKTESDDKRFSAKDGILIAHPAKEGKKEIKDLWTVREFPKDFELRLEFRA